MPLLLATFGHYDACSNAPALKSWCWHFKTKVGGRGGERKKMKGKKKERKKMKVWDWVTIILLKNVPNLTTFPSAKLSYFKSLCLFFCYHT